MEYEKPAVRDYGDLTTLTRGSESDATEAVAPVGHVTRPRPQPLQ